MKNFYLIATLVLLTFSVRAQKDEQDEAMNVSEKCNCNAKQFQKKYAEAFTDDKYITDFLLDYPSDSSMESVTNTMKQKLAVSLAKKIRSNIKVEEKHTISETTENKNSNLSENYSSTAKIESNVDLSGTNYRICPDKKQEHVYHGFIYVNKGQFLSSQLSMYTMAMRELQTQVNLVAKNLMDYNMKDLAKEYSNCLKKQDKANQIANIYSSVSSNNEIVSNPEIKKMSDDIIPKLAQMRKRLYNKDVDRKVDSARLYIETKRYPEAMAFVDQVLQVNPDHEQMRELQKQCAKLWADEAVAKTDDLVKNKKFEEALTYVKQALSYKISEDAMNAKLTTVSEAYFNDGAAGVQAKLDANDVPGAKKLLKKLQPMAKVNQSKYDELAAAIKKKEW
jgi:tetratricopeptide (TPR) repeat protein